MAVGDAIREALEAAAEVSADGALPSGYAEDFAAEWRAAAEGRLLPFDALPAFADAMVQRGWGSRWSLSPADLRLLGRFDSSGVSCGAAAEFAEDHCAFDPSEHVADARRTASESPARRPARSASPDATVSEAAFAAACKAVQGSPADADESAALLWRACVSEPKRRPVALPLLLQSAESEEDSAAADTSALALTFLSFSQSGTQVAVEPPGATPESSARAPVVVFVLGWAGSHTDEIAVVAAEWRKRVPGAVTVCTVGGSNRWTDPQDGRPDHPGNAAEQQQIDTLLSFVSETGPAVIFHLFSNNGVMLFTRILRRLQSRDRIAGMVFDSAPYPSGGPEAAAVMERVATTAAASALRSVQGFSMSKLSERRPLRRRMSRLIRERGLDLFDSSWHFDLLREIEPACPTLFLYSKVDRIISQDVVEGWMAETRARQPERAVSCHCFDRTHHVQHHLQAAEQYSAQLARFAEGLLPCVRG